MASILEAYKSVYQNLVKEDIQQDADASLALKDAAKALLNLSASNRKLHHVLDGRDFDNAVHDLIDFSNKKVGELALNHDSNKKEQSVVDGLASIPHE